MKTSTHGLTVIFNDALREGGRGKYLLIILSNLSLLIKQSHKTLRVVRLIYTLKFLRSKRTQTRAERARGSSFSSEKWQTLRGSADLNDPKSPPKAFLCQRRSAVNEDISLSLLNVFPANGRMKNETTSCQNCQTISWWSAAADNWTAGLPHWYSAQNTQHKC